MKHYAVTLKFNQHPNPQIEHYVDASTVMLLIYNKILIYKWCFETDSKNKIHCHLHVVCQYIHWKKYKDLMTSKGYWIDIRELKNINDQDQWDNYLSKEDLSTYECEQINIINDYRNMNPFEINI